MGRYEAQVRKNYENWHRQKVPHDFEAITGAIAHLPTLRVTRTVRVTLGKIIF